MKQALLENFNSMDAGSFTELLLHLGFTTGAFYRLDAPLSLVQVLASDLPNSAVWPAAVTLTSHYTSPEDSLPPRGWVRLDSLPISSTPWPKSSVFYIPEQAFETDKVLFVGLMASGKRVRSGELDGPLEAVSTRLRAWFRDQASRHSMNEGAIKEHLKRLEIDLRMVIDHELRTPLSSISGYTSLLATLSPDSGPAVRQEYLQVLETEIERAVKAIDKISLALYADKRQEPSSGLQAFDGAEVVLEICDKMQTQAGDGSSDTGQKNLSLQVRKVTDQACLLRADLSLFHTAVWEVVKNAAAHARTGKVNVQIYVSDAMLVIDVEDDGSGVSVGAEDLIFLRFYQDPNSSGRRRGKRGVGLGLFLARQIVEQHLGRLLFIRQKGGSLFRFLWPLDGEARQHG